MKNYVLTFFLFLVMLFSCAFSPIGIQTGGPEDGDKMILGGSFRLQEGQTVDGDLVVIGGNATIEKNATVKGNLVLIGGTADISGNVIKDVSSIGGVISLTDTAFVHGDLVTYGGTVQQANYAVVKGKIIAGGPGDFDFGTWSPFSSMRLPKSPFQGLYKPIGEIFGVILRSLAMALLAMLLSLFVEKPAHTVADYVVNRVFLSGGLGLLTLVVAPILFLIIALTIILLPVGFLGLLALASATLFGWISIGLEIGDRLVNIIKVEWSPPVSAGMGTLLMSMVAFGFGLIPCVGWIVQFLIGIIGLGGVLLSWFGTHPLPDGSMK